MRTDKVWIRFLDQRPSKAQKKRISILEAALKVIDQYGLGFTSISKIGIEAKISKSLILYHYQGVDEILADLFKISGKSGQQFTEEALLKKTSLPEKLSAIIEGAFNWTLSEPALGRFFILMYHQATVSQSIYKIHQIIIKTGEQRIRFYLLEGGFKAGREVEALVQAIHSVIIGALTKMVSLKEEKHYQIYVESVSQAVGAIVGKKMPKIKNLIK